MRSEAIIVVGVTFQNSAQMRLAQDNNVVTFTPVRSDQPFGKSILPGRRCCNGPIPARNIDPVAIADHVARRFIPRGSEDDELYVVTLGIEYADGMRAIYELFRGESYECVELMYRVSQPSHDQRSIESWWMQCGRLDAWVDFVQREPP